MCLRWNLCARISVNLIQGVIHGSDKSRCLCVLCSFQTESGRLYCCKHDEPWVRKKVRQLMQVSLTHSLTYSFTHTLIHSHTFYEKQNLSLCVCVSQAEKKSSIGLYLLPPEGHHLQLRSSTIGGNHRHALSALYRPIEMHLIQRRPMSTKMADQILLKRKTMNC